MPRTETGNLSKGVAPAMTVVLFFISIFFVATILLIIYSLQEQDSKLPDKIDVVVIIRAEGMGIHHQQIKAIDEHMPFRNNIFVLSDQATGDVSKKYKVNNVYNFKFEPKLDTESILHQYFLAVPQILNIAPNFIFLSDQTVPMRKLRKSAMFRESKPRMFNVFRDKAETDYFLDYFNETVPTLSQTLELYNDPPNHRDYKKEVADIIFREITEYGAVLRSDMNLDVIINSEMETNSNKQLTNLTKHEPLFATFHISGDSEKAKDTMLTYLKSRFK
jgi:hypothetical protein